MRALTLHSLNLPSKVMLRCWEELNFKMAKYTEKWDMFSKRKRKVKDSVKHIHFSP